MSLLKRENWWIYVLISFLSCGIFTFILATDMNLFEKDAWYSKWYYWVLGVAFFILPAIVMLIVLNIKMQCEICKKLHVTGEQYYGYPYLWLLSLIVPILGWATFIVMCLHVYFYPAIMIYQGEGEKLCQSAS